MRCRVGELGAVRLERRKEGRRRCVGIGRR